MKFSKKTFGNRSFSRREFLKSSSLSMAAVLASSCKPTSDGEKPLGEQAILIRNGRLIDGKGSEPIPNTSILIENGKFSEIRPSDIDVPATATVIEANGQTVMPGLIDMHAHLLSGGFDTVSEKSMSYDPADQQRALKQMLYWGITSVYDPVQPLEQGLRLRDQIVSKAFPAPRLFISGPGFTAPGGWAGSNDPNARFEPTDPSEVKEQIEALANAGIGIVKVFYDDMNVSFAQTLPKLEEAMMQTIISEAHAYGMKVMVHAYDTADQKNVIRAGANVMAHSAVTMPVDEEYIAEAKKADILYLATLSVYHDVFDENVIREFITQDFVQRTVPKKTLDSLSSPEPLDSFAKSIKQDNIKRLYPTIQENLKRIAESGVAIGVGPDTGVPGSFPGIGVHREMELMTQAGVSPSDVLIGATRTGAQWLGLESLGTIENGKIADLIILDGDPLTDITSTREISAVIQHGAIVDREQLLKETLA